MSGLGLAILNGAAMEGSEGRAEGNKEVSHGKI